VNSTPVISRTRYIYRGRNRVEVQIAPGYSASAIYLGFSGSDGSLEELTLVYRPPFQ
jgi:hypothetical protein